MLNIQAAVAAAILVGGCTKLEQPICNERQRELPKILPFSVATQSSPPLTSSRVGTTHITQPAKAKQ